MKCVRTYIYVHTYICIYAHLYIETWYIHACIYVYNDMLYVHGIDSDQKEGLYIQVYRYICMYHVSTYIHTCIYRCIKYVHTYIHVHICIYVCMYIYI